MKNQPANLTLSALLEENALLKEEVRVARRASEITAELVVQQFQKMEIVHHRLQEQAAIEQHRQFLAEKLHQAELRERALAEAHAVVEEASRAKSRFLANMSHELRTPLNAIIGYSELLVEEIDALDKESFASDLNRIISAGKHLLSLINDILDLSKIESGKSLLHLEMINTPILLQEIIETVQPLVDQKHNSLELITHTDLGFIQSDLTRLKQCLFNLLSNACKFTEKGKITIKASREKANSKEWLYVHIQDTGIGMSPEQIVKVFQPFAQADPSLTRKYGGTGLGLAITKSICESMGGKISVVSELGKGSTFTVCLPTIIAVVT